MLKKLILLLEKTYNLTLKLYYELYIFSEPKKLKTQYYKLFKPKSPTNQSFGD